MPKTNRISRAVANRAAFARRMGLGYNNFDRIAAPQFRRKQYRNMGAGIRRLAGTIITNRLGGYYRRNR